MTHANDTAALRAGCYRLDGRVALVTGGASGMGFAIAARLLQEGARVAILDYDDDAVEAAAAELAAGDQLLALRGDVSAVGDVDDAVSTVVAQFGGIDILVNNAGVFDHNLPCEELEEDVWDRLMAINAKGYAFTMKRVLREMLSASRGSIVNNCSVSALVAGGGGAAYAASKGAILALSRQVAFEVGSRGVRVNAIAPGAIDTNLVANSPSIPGQNPSTSMQRRFHEAMVSGTLAKIPLGRSAQSSEIASVAAFLASDDAAYMTGECLVVDGGYVIS